MDYQQVCNTENDIRCNYFKIINVQLVFMTILLKRLSAILVLVDAFDTTQDHLKSMSEDKKMIQFKNLKYTLSLLHSHAFKPKNLAGNWKKNWQVLS